MDNDYYHPLKDLLGTNYLDYITANTFKATRWEEWIRLTASYQKRQHQQAPHDRRVCDEGLEFNVKKRLVFILFVSNFQTAYRLSWETGVNVQKNKQVVWGWGRSMWLVIGFSHHRSHLLTLDPPLLFKNQDSVALYWFTYFIYIGCCPEDYDKTWAKQWITQNLDIFFHFINSSTFYLFDMCTWRLWYGKPVVSIGHHFL